MTTELQQLLQDQFLGKVILVPVPDRDNRGKVIPNKFVDCAGQCTFVGSNEVLGYDFMVVIDGMPVQVNHINDIRLRLTKKRYVPTI